MEGILNGTEPPLLAPGREDEDAINEYLYEQHQDLLLSEVLAAFHTSYQWVLAATEALRGRR